MASYQSEGIVIRKVNVGEADQIITLFSPIHGKIELMAKGVRRMTSRKSGNLELINFVKLLLANGRSLDIVLEADCVHPYAMIRQDLKKSAYVYIAAEAFYKLVPVGLIQPRLFTLLQSYLEHICVARSSYQYEHLTQGMLFKLLLELGFVSELTRCVNCRASLTNAPLSYSPSQGGFLCPTCALGKKLWDFIECSQTTIKLLRFYSYSGLERVMQLMRVQEDIAGQISSVVENSLTDVAERKFFAPAFLQQVSAME